MLRPRLVHQHASLLYTTAILRPSIFVRISVYRSSLYTATAAGVQVKKEVDAQRNARTSLRVEDKKAKKPADRQTKLDIDDLVTLKNKNPSASNGTIAALRASRNTPKHVPSNQAAIKERRGTVKNNRMKALKDSAPGSELSNMPHTRHSRTIFKSIFGKAGARRKRLKADESSILGSLAVGKAINGEIAGSKMGERSDKQAQSTKHPASSLSTLDGARPPNLIRRLRSSPMSRRATLPAGSLSTLDRVRPPSLIRRLRSSPMSRRAKPLIRFRLQNQNSSSSLVRFTFATKLNICKIPSSPELIKTTGGKVEKEKEKGIQPKKRRIRSNPGSIRTAGGRKRKRKRKEMQREKSDQEKEQEDTQYEMEAIEARDLRLVPINKPQPPVPGLEYGLERVLFNPGVYHLQDPRSRVFNFDPYLQTIMPVADFDFSALKEYITSSRDENLESIAVTEGKKYTGSTSSMTSALAHFHFLLSNWRPVTISNLSQGFPEHTRSFTLIQRAPSAIFLKWKDGTYAIDADKEFDKSNILMMLGKSMEKLLTTPTNKFERYRKRNSEQIKDEDRNEPQSYHYTTMGDFLMRSQLDAHHPSIPGTGMFDLKTRAVISVRMDAQNYHSGSGYEIRRRFGEFESYEREYYDMIRSAFLKYSLQVRMGRMDGIFVAYHNVERIFGFQYISLEEMDLALHGQEDLTVGDSEFKLSLDLLNRVLDRATTKFPKQSLRLFFETRNTKMPWMNIFAEPIQEEQIQAIQESKKAEIEEYERSILGLDRNSPGVKDEEKKGDLKIEQTKFDETVHSLGSTKDEGRDGQTAQDKQPEVLAMKLRIKNKVDGFIVARPSKIGPKSRWSVQYSLVEEPKQSRSRLRYEATKLRRAEALSGDKPNTDTTSFRRSFLEKLIRISMEGRRWRQKQTKIDQSSPVEVLKGQSWSSQ